MTTPEALHKQGTPGFQEIEAQYKEVEAQVKAGRIPLNGQLKTIEDVNLFFTCHITDLSYSFALIMQKFDFLYERTYALERENQTLRQQIHQSTTATTTPNAPEAPVVVTPKTQGQGVSEREQRASRRNTLKRTPPPPSSLERISVKKSKLDSKMMESVDVSTAVKPQPQTPPSLIVPETTTAVTSPFPPWYNEFPSPPRLTSVIEDLSPF